MEAIPRVLLIDDDVAIHKAVEFRLRGSAELTACESADGALAQVRASQFDAALVDVNLGAGPSGIQLVSRLQAADPDLAAVIFTAHSDYATAFGSLEAHSFDFIPKSLGDDQVFWAKINQAVVRTREQRGRSRSATDAVRLRTALADAVVNNALEVTGSDIQRGLLGESLHSFSSLLGRVELLNLCLKKRSVDLPELADMLELSDDTVTELQEYVGKLRDYFAEPDRAVRSVNEVLGQAVRILQDEAPDAMLLGTIECGGLEPDRVFAADGRALLRTIVILLRMLLQAAPVKAAFKVRPLLLLNPLAELSALKARSHTCVLTTPDFDQEDEVAVVIEISGRSAGRVSRPGAGLFTQADLSDPESAPWGLVAMVAKFSGALMVESKPGALPCYRIVFKG